MKCRQEDSVERSLSGLNPRKRLRETDEWLNSIDAVLEVGNTPFSDGEQDLGFLQRTKDMELAKRNRLRELTRRIEDEDYICAHVCINGCQKMLAVAEMTDLLNRK
jgi:hypothetical protein